MRRLLFLLAVPVTAAMLLLAGCTATDTGTTVPPTLATPPQTAELDWLEPFPATSPALVFGVARFTVTVHGWSADLSVENRSDTGFKIVARHDEATLRFGVALFLSNSPDELDRRINAADPPTTRAATRYVPRLPVVLGPGATWRGTISAPGALPGGLWARIVFGPFSSVGEPPQGVPATALTWYTDHAYHLQDVSAVPA